MNSEQIHALVEKQRTFFNSGATLPVETRLSYLQRIKNYLLQNEVKINQALYSDLGKSGYEAYLTEVGVVISEVSFMLKHLRSFAKDRTVPTPFGQQIARSYVKAKPYGVTLIMSPWNYPFMLTLPPDRETSRFFLISRAVSSTSFFSVSNIPSPHSLIASLFIVMLWSNLA